ncbi:MAG: hypothetical protein ACPG51_17770 [Thiolinea sp.]
MDYSDTEVENPATGVDGGVFDQSTFGDGDNQDYTQNQDRWKVTDNHRMRTDLMDFLDFDTKKHGVDVDLVKAVNLVKIRSERLAFAGGEYHGC